MPPFSCFIFILLFFSSQTTAIHNHNRRILHQPFIPLDSLPPAEPPNPPPPPKQPKHTLSSTSPSAPYPPTFFPKYPPAPPPPSAANFASFPANISSLILPHSSDKANSTSHKLLPLAIAAVISAVVVAAIVAFLYRWHRRNRSFADDKSTFRSENSHRFPAVVNAEGINRGIPKLRNPSASSSEFLYLGTLVDSRGIGNRSGSRNNNGRSSDDTRKMESPELHPLPPLGSLSRLNTNVRQNRGNVGDVSSTGDDEDEEFYSPRGSSIASTGSGSRRVFAAAAMAAEDILGKSSDSSSTCSSYSTSSGSASPAQSHSKSLSLSPMGSSSPTQRSEPKSLSPEFSTTTPIELLPPCFSPERVSSLTISNASSFHNINFPSSPPSDKTSENGVSGAPSDLNEQSPSSPCLSPLSVRAIGGTVIPTTAPRISNVSDPNSVTNTPSYTSSSSPDRIHLDTSPRLSNVSSDPHPCSLPDNPVHISSQNEGSPERNTANQQPLSGLPALPPPPPPPPPSLPKHWEAPISPSMPTPVVQQPMSRPPPLIPPSRPFVFENQTKVSPSEWLPNSSANTVVETFEDTLKPRLKTLHWDKVRASSDRKMVWDQLGSSSFKLNEEMIETLFIVNDSNSKPKHTTPLSVLPTPNQETSVLDPKKSQNIAIALRALNVTIEEVCDALLEGNADALGTELLESLLKMAPTKEEEHKLKEYKDESPIKLGPAEKFLKAVLEVPFAFKRVDVLLYMSNFDAEVEYLEKSFETLEAASEELRSSRMFLKLLEAVLKTGNRMNIGTNRGDAQAFKLDTLLKLVDVKGADGKTTLLHFVVQEIIRTEGACLSGTNQSSTNSSLSDEAKCRKLGLQVVSGLSSELTNVKKAAAMDSDILTDDVSKLSQGIDNIRIVLRLNEEMGTDESSEKFSGSINKFAKMAEEEIIRIQAHESVALSLVKEITEYFHGNSAQEEAHPFRIFMVVRDFLAILDRVCKEVGMINQRTIVSSAHKFPIPVNPILTQFPGFPGRQQYSSSDDESELP